LGISCKCRSCTPNYKDRHDLEAPIIHFGPMSQLLFGAAQQFSHPRVALADIQASSSKEEGENGWCLVKNRGS
jgi:hypothetical protein